ncbi:MAG: hypothetical protein ACFFC7_02355 [Candidatus Hermodarchaeota archaeon]
MIPAEVEITANKVVQIDSSINPKFSPSNDYLLVEITDSIQLFQVRKLIEQYYSEVQNPVVIRGVGRGLVPSLTLYHLFKLETNIFCIGSTFKALINQKKEDTGVQLVLFQSPPFESSEQDVSYPKISKDQTISVTLNNEEPGFFARSDYLLIELYGAARMFRLKRQILDYIRKHKAPVVFRAVGYKGIPISVRLAEMLKTEGRKSEQIIETFSAITRSSDPLSTRKEKKITGLQIVLFNP